MPFKVAFLDNVHEHLQTAFLNQGWQVDTLFDLDREELKQVIGSYDGIILRSRIKMNQDFLQYATKLRFIGRPGAGLENIDLEFCEKQGIKVFRSPEGNRDAVAEQALGMLLSLFNNLNRADAEVRKGIWRREENRGVELMGKTVGIIGYGYMGAAFAQRVRCFGVEIIAYDKYKTGFGSGFVQEVSLDTLKNQADVVSLHVPQTNETIGLVNARFLSEFKKNIYLINTARGSSVVIKDLMSAITNGKVLGACLDVLEYESTSFENIASDFPSEFQQLLTSDKVLLSPHVAGWTHEAKLKMAEFLAQKIIHTFS